MAEFNDASANISSAHVVSSANLNFGSTLADNAFFQSSETIGIPNSENLFVGRLGQLVFDTRWL